MAACEEMDGPTEQELDAIRAATFTVEAIAERERVTDHDTAAFVDVLAASAGPAGRWIHYGLTSSDVLDTGLALQLRRVGELVLPDSRRWSRRSPRPRASTSTRCAPGARTASTPSRPRSGSSSPGSRSRRTATPSGWSARSRRRASARSRAPSAPTPRPRRTSRSACWRGSGSPASRSRRRSWPATATPSCSRRSRWPARASSASPPSSATSPGPRSARCASRSAAGRRGRARCPTSATRSSPSRSSGSRGCCAATPRPRSRTSRCGTSATSPTPRSSGSSCPTRRSCSTTSSGATLALVEGMVVDAERMRENLELTHGALFSQRVLLALVESGLGRDDAYRVVQRLAQEAIDSRVPMRELLAADPAGAGLDLDAIFDYAPVRALRRGDRRAARRDQRAAGPRAATAGTYRRRATRPGWSCTGCATWPGQVRDLVGVAEATDGHACLELVGLAGEHPGVGDQRRCDRVDGDARRRRRALARKCVRP